MMRGNADPICLPLSENLGIAQRRSLHGNSGEFDSSSAAIIIHKCLPVPPVAVNTRCCHQCRPGARSHARTQADPHRSFVYRGSFTPAGHLPDRAKMKNGKRIRDFPAGLPQRDLSG